MNPPAIAAAIGAIVAIGAPAASAALRYPDLKTQPPTDLTIAHEEIGGHRQYVLRFTNTVYNAGNGPLELRGVPSSQDGSPALQVIYGDSRADVATRPAGEFEWHPQHDHFHYRDFTRFELWTAAAHEDAQRGGDASSLVSSRKLGACIFDNVFVGGVDPERWSYGECGTVVQGLSPGWGDRYAYSIPDQFIVLGAGPLPDGEYVLTSVADPDNHLHESGGGQSDAAEAPVSNGAAKRFTVVDNQVVEAVHAVNTSTE